MDAEARAPGLSEEQRAVIIHITGPEHIAVVAGAAGAEKSTALAAARMAWEAEGYRVLGAARAASAKVGEGIAAYAARGRVHMAESRGAAKAAIARDSAMAAWGEGQTLILAHTNDDVRDLNLLVRGQRQRAGALGAEVSFATERGERQFAAGDRLVFVKNDRELGVKNGTLATIEQAENERLIVRIDGGERIRIDQETYAHIDHGDAVTLHKAQGATVDRAFVLASGGMDRHLIYVGMTRHREDAAARPGSSEGEHARLRGAAGLRDGEAGAGECADLDRAGPGVSGGDLGKGRAEPRRRAGAVRRPRAGGGGGGRAAGGAGAAGSGA